MEDLKRAGAAFDLEIPPWFGFRVSEGLLVLVHDNFAVGIYYFRSLVGEYS